VRTRDCRGIPLMVRARAELRIRLHKERGHLTTSVVEGIPNALTDLEVLARERDGTTVLRLQPRAGRTHQLRAQLSARGAPSLGEDLYPRPMATERDQRHLHLPAHPAHSTDPLAGQPRAPPPPRAPRR